MTFTDADNVKAVELYKTYKDAEWWPERLCRYRDAATEEMWWYDYIEQSWLVPDIALSAIAWAMVERLGDVELYHYADIGMWIAKRGMARKGRFLALAAAVEALDKGG